MAAGVVAWCAGLAVAGKVAYASLAGPSGGERVDDLKVYLTSTRGLNDGAGLYAYHSGIQDGFTYPPFAGILLFPLNRMPFLTAAITWTSLTLVSIAILAVTAGRALSKTAHGFTLLSGAIFAALAVSAPVASDLRFGQISLILAAPTALAILNAGRSRVPGLIIGTLSGIKLTPLIYIPYLVTSGSRRNAVTAALTFLATIILALIFLPRDSLHFWTSTIFDGTKVHAFTSSGNISLAATLQRLAITGNLGTAIWCITAATVFASSLWRATCADRNGNHLAALVIMGAASLAISPISWTHHQIWLVLAAFTPVRGARNFKILWTTTVLVVMIAPLAEARPALTLLTASLVPFRGTVGWSARDSLAWRTEGSFFRIGRFVPRLKYLR
ncbi:glycosyltransferase 87 family protein [Actinomadura rupiterrae]|uniref:glycosyltransferase 87 family protein n=1 Tax=Actinomadura rupiterrae TaxID=559627 RepID=UPI0020A5C352|nr:glycosyltransferase 87 family protein [Actinomadura rupiterrae]MCP2343167.1 alpha-1,2-mannosyltransferase [Actinomadura rupiterrae]